MTNLKLCKLDIWNCTIIP